MPLDERLWPESGHVREHFGPAWDSNMLITPSATPYDAMEPEMIVAMPLHDADAWEGPDKAVHASGVFTWIF